MSFLAPSGQEPAAALWLRKQNHLNAQLRHDSDEEAEVRNFHIDKCRKLNSAALGHLEEIQLIKAVELTINTLAKQRHSGAHVAPARAFPSFQLLLMLTPGSDNV